MNTSREKTATREQATLSSSIFKHIAYYMNPVHLLQADKKRTYLWIFWIFFNIFLYLLPNEMIYGSVLCLLPFAGQFAYAIITHEVYESLVLGTIANHLMWYKGDFLQGFYQNVMGALTDGDTVLMLVSFFLCGGMIVAFSRSGVTKAFSDFIMKKFGANDKVVLISSAVFTGILSVDDYIASLTSGAAFSPLMDGMKRPRMALSYISKTFSTCVSCLLPFGAWGYFVIYQIAAAENVNGLTEASSIFMQTIPFQVFGIVACVVALLFGMGLFPKIGKMKEAYQMAENGEQYGAAVIEGEEDDIAMIEEMIANDPRKQNVSIWNLIIPMASIVICLFAFNFNGFLAFMVPLLLTGALYILQGIFSLGEYVDCLIQGCRDMMDMTLILIIGYATAGVMESMGLNEFLLDICQLVPIAALLPFLFFVYFGLEEYVLTMNYTLFLILFPSLMVILPQVGANVPLCLGAILSAGLFGANNCIISDLGVIAAKSCRVGIYEQFVACQPYYWICYGITAVVYLVLGFIF